MLGEVATIPMGNWSVYGEGDALYDAMLRDIAAATQSIRMESYIFASDRIGRRFLDALAQAAGRGVKVALRVDHAGSFFELSRSEVRVLRRAGVDFRWSRRWNPWRPWRLNRRNHRKLLIIDRSHAYLGGFNVHAPSSLVLHGPERWRDTHVRLDGPLVVVAAQIFDGCWADRIKPIPVPPAVAGRRLIPTSSRQCRHVWRCALQDAFKNANRRIWLTTPYFVPDRRLQKLLINAACSGADVRLLVPGKSDVAPAQWAARAAYSALLSAGVRIFEFVPRMLHAKTMLVDDHWAAVGTANLDYRSLFVNDEINLTDTTGELNGVLVRMFEQDLSRSSEVQVSPWRDRPWTSWFTETIGWVMRRWL